MSTPSRNPEAVQAADRLIDAILPTAIERLHPLHATEINGAAVAGFITSLRAGLITMYEQTPREP
ncbi:hypothetical protein [uncultured Zoogloea sp.]|uniref:hypothetical protein n=1 Tax=uncultured Zoogloea sp. TaxID=160237 RepID=UPI002611F21C|nr:hypothetical protein [uncultured Zoogloea sp.]